MGHIVLSFNANELSANVVEGGPAVNTTTSDLQQHSLPIAYRAAYLPLRGTLASVVQLSSALRHQTSVNRAYLQRRLKGGVVPASSEEYSARFLVLGEQDSVSQESTRWGAL